MKYLISLFVFALLSLNKPIFSNPFDENQKEHLIQIQTEKSDNEKFEKTKDAGDVDVFKMDCPDFNRYRFSYYRIEKDTIWNHNASYYSQDLFSHAFYFWKNDSTISIRLVNFNTQQESPTFIASGWIGRTGRVSSLGIEDEQKGLK